MLYFVWFIIVIILSLVNEFIVTFYAQVSSATATQAVGKEEKASSRKLKARLQFCQNKCPIH